MCVVMHLLDGQEIESVAEFEAYFKVDANKFADPTYGSLIMDSCLCQLDITDYMRHRHEFETDDGGVSYWEKPMTE